MPHRRGNQLVVGSTQSGKSYGEVQDVLAAAEDRRTAIVVLDPHPRSLARNCLLHLDARGHRGRILWDELDELLRVPKYRLLMQSRAAGLQREHDHERLADQFAELLCRRRESASLAAAPQTEEYTKHGLRLLLEQRRQRPAADLRFAFQVGHRRFARLLAECRHEETEALFRQIADGSIRPGQYAAARRLIEGVCGSPSFVVRCGTRFDVGAFLDDRGILLVEGGTSPLVTQTLLGAIVLQVIHYVRTRPRPLPRILLVLDEATNANLVGAAGHEVRALAECQKMGLDVHILVQSLNFPSAFVTDGVLTNCTRHVWYYAANAAVARKAADDLGEPELAEVVRALKVGERYVKERERVFFERVPALANPWTLEELARRKLAAAVAAIRARSEYGPPDDDSGDDSCTGMNATPPSSDSPSGTSAPADISSATSPAVRRRTAGSKRSAPEENSGS
ncbi:MAG: hypothetical protein J0M17_16395 [Planctomycetes bacterium]|nr:hypothetical protein [Planctomycetota bacterium]